MPARFPDGAAGTPLPQCDDRALLRGLLPADRQELRLWLHRFKSAGRKRLDLPASTPSISSADAGGITVLSLERVVGTPALTGLRLALSLPGTSASPDDTHTRCGLDGRGDPSDPSGQRASRLRHHLLSSSAPQPTRG